MSLVKFSGPESLPFRLALSVLSGRPLRIDGIRSKDTNPGLRGLHPTARLASPLIALQTMKSVYSASSKRSPMELPLKFPILVLPFEKPVFYHIDGSCRHLGASEAWHYQRWPRQPRMSTLSFCGLLPRADTSHCSVCQKTPVAHFARSYH